MAIMQEEHLERYGSLSAHKQGVIATAYNGSGTFSYPITFPHQALTGTVCDRGGHNDCGFVIVDPSKFKIICYKDLAFLAIALGY